MHEGENLWEAEKIFFLNSPGSYSAIGFRTIGAFKKQISTQWH